MDPRPGGGRSIPLAMVQTWEVASLTTSVRADPTRIGGKPDSDGATNREGRRGWLPQSHSTTEQDGSPRQPSTGAINHQHPETKRRGIAVARSTTGRAPARAEPALTAAELASSATHRRSDLGGPRPRSHHHLDMPLANGSPPLCTTHTVSSPPVPPRTVLPPSREAPCHPRPVCEGKEVPLALAPHRLRLTDALRRRRSEGEEGEGPWPATALGFPFAHAGCVAGTGMGSVSSSQMFSPTVPDFNFRPEV